MSFEPCLTAALAAVGKAPPLGIHGPYKLYELYELKGLYALYLMSCSRFDDFEEICRFQGCTTDKSTIHVRIRENSVGISSVISFLRKGLKFRQLRLVRISLLQQNG